MRCQDVHTSVGQIDPNSSVLAKVSDTRLVGMIASVASAIRGNDIIHDGQALAEIAAEQLDVSPYAFPRVISTLEEVGWISNVKRKQEHVISFHESIPLHQSLYDGLGAVWRNKEPDEFEQSFVSIAERLTRGPVAEEQLSNDVGYDKRDHDKLLTLALDADLVKRIIVPDGKILYSPFFFFENSNQLADVMLEHSPARFQEEFERVRSYQGLPVNSEDTPVLQDAVARGLVMASTVLDPLDIPRSFACIPYSIDSSLLKERKQVLTIALTVLACVRCGQNFGGASSIERPLSIIDALLNDDRQNMLTPHSSHRRQYHTLWNAGIVDFVESGNWVSPKLRKSPDNIDGLRLARDLIAFGENLQARSSGAETARTLLMNSSRYEAPIETVHRLRTRIPTPAKELQSLFGALMGHTAI